MTKTGSAGIPSSQPLTRLSPAIAIIASRPAAQVCPKARLALRPDRPDRSHIWSMSRNFRPSLMGPRGEMNRLSHTPIDHIWNVRISHSVLRCAFLRHGGASTAAR